MPGPANRRGKARRPPPRALPAAEGSTSTAGRNERNFEISDEDSWDRIVDGLCRFFGIPDLKKKSGLKRVHAEFDAIYRKLDAAYEANPDERFRGGIIGIFTTMCIDSVLRNKVFERGFLARLIPMLNVDGTRHLALRALATMTRYGGVQVRVEIARLSANTIANLIQNFPDDDRIADLGVCTLSHSVNAVFEGPKGAPANPSILESLEMGNILQSLVDAVRRPLEQLCPAKIRSMVTHIAELLPECTMHSTDAFLVECPPAVDFLIAGLRCADWAIRCDCLMALLRLHHKHAQEDSGGIDSNRMIGVLSRGLPQHLDSVMRQYGLNKCEMPMVVQASDQYQTAMVQVLADRDLYKLGVKLIPLILTTEYAVSDGFYGTITGERLTESFGLPFRAWADALPHCATAIRAKGKKEEMDWADILDIKHFILRRRLADAVKIAKKGLERNPQIAYFYYTLTLSADVVQGLRAAKQGLKCNEVTPFLRFQMLRRAVEHASGIGVKALQQRPQIWDKKWEEGIAFLMSSVEDAKTYVEEAPPDSRHMKNAAYWYILLSVVTREELSPDLHELEDALARLKRSEEFNTLMGIPPPNTNLRLVQQIIVKRFAPANRLFGPVFDRVARIDAIQLFTDSQQRQAQNREHRTPTLPIPDIHARETLRAPTVRERVEENLAAWLNDSTAENPGGGHGYGAVPVKATVDFEYVTLYKCNWCGNPSAALKKCAGCSKTRYCDTWCQKSHWRDHKKDCQKRTEAEEGK